MSLAIIVGLSIVLFVLLAGFLFFRQEIPIISFGFFFLSLLQVLVLIAAITAEAMGVSLATFLGNYLNIALIAIGFTLVGMVIAVVLAILSFGNSEDAKKWGLGKWG